MDESSNCLRPLLKRLHQVRGNPRDVNYQLMEIASEFEYPVPPLVASLSDPDPEIRSGAALATGYIQSYTKREHRIDDALELLEEPIQDETGWVKFHSAKALWAISVRPGYQRLLMLDRMMQKVQDCLKCSNPEVGAAAAYQLIRPGTIPELAVPALIDALGEPELEVRFAAAGALCRFGPEAGDAVSALTPWLESPLPAERFVASAAILRTDGCYDNSLVPTLLNSFQLMESCPSLQVRREVYRTAAAQLLNWFERIAYLTVPLLARCCRPDEHHQLRLAATETIASAGFSVEEAMWALVDALQDTSREVVSAAMCGLTAWSKWAVVALPNLLRVLDVECYMGPQRHRRQADERSDVIAGACKLLWEIGPKARAAIPYLLRLMREESPEIRRSARSALKTITSGLARYTFEYSLGERRIRTTVFGQNLDDARKAFRQRLLAAGHLSQVDVERCEPRIRRRR